MRPTVSAVLALALLALAGTPGRAQLATTDSMHYRAGPEPVVGGSPGRGPKDFTGPSYRGRVVLRKDTSLRNLGQPSRQLSKACRDGRFRQTIDRRYMAKLDDKFYGAAIGGGSGIYDPQGVGQAGQVYVFVGQGTTNCQVYQGGPPNVG